MKYLSRVLSVLCVLVLFGSTCSAMTFYPMEKLGRILYLQAGSGGIGIDNATTNRGTYYTKYNKNNTRSYEKGVASFGSGSSALYFYYDFNRSPMIRIGNRQGDTVYDGIDIGYEVNRISSDSGITLYPLLFCYGPECFYQIYGIRADGKCVKYIDLGALIEQYCGGKGTLNVTCADIVVRRDTIIVPLRSYGQKGPSIGEFIFKWDELAQWFSVALNKY